ncbi:MAG TPA: carboxypeptidase-like regulatory domain-containing protein, partial [Thermoanaerobaculia bacterium]|nr:carboxypeptidase-like regulatory domain-containing protein [Thermoanaerobaculia bacterium]
GTFELATGLTVEGVVVDSQGRPLPDTALWLRPWKGDEKLFLRQGPRHVTGPDGRFSIAHLETGKEWTLYACRKGHPEVVMKVSELAPEPLRIVLAPARRLTGKVIDPDGKPIPGANVTAGLAGEYPGDLVDTGRPHCSGDHRFPQAYTDREGRFVLEPLRSGFYDLQAAAEGWLETEHGRLEVRDGREPEEVEIVLQPGAILTGKVLTQDGSPAAGIKIQAQGYRNYPSTRTDAAGSYRLAGVESGWNKVVASSALGSVSKKLKIEPGENRLDMTLGPAYPGPLRHEIRGRVSGPEGEPVEGAHVVMGLAETFTGPDGSFTLRAGEGQFEITVWKEGYGAASVEGDIRNMPAEGLEIRLERSLTLTGRLLGLDPAEISIASVSVRGSGFDHRSNVFPDGTYRIGDLGPGEWRVVAEAGTRRSEAQVALRPGEDQATLDLVFSERFDVRGRIVGPGGEGLPGAGVRFQSSERWKYVETSEDGTFAVRLENGEYNFQARAPGHLSSPPQTLTVADAPVDGLEIRLESGLGLRGCLRDLSSYQDPGDRVSSIQAVGPNGPIPHASPDPEGCYQFDNLGPGNWTLSVTLFELRPGGRNRSARQEVSIRPGTEAVADLDLFLGTLTLSGRIEAAASEPLEVLAKLLLPDGTLLIDDSHQLREGAFRFERLRAGSYRVQILDAEGTPLLDQPIDLTSDQEIVLSLALPRSPR